ncbi:hypothetical protein [Nostoc commune]|uniref:hypothetical protein n=1 Tax=Nostoc commune TaxID=1178 RepID=UPI0018C6FBF8|nr:hypothetical protein [Nostoc commune]
MALSGDAMALSGDAMALSGDAMALSGDAMALLGDAMALSGDAMALSGDAMALLGDAMALPNFIRSVLRAKGRKGTQSLFEGNLLQQINAMLYLGSLRCRTNNLFIGGKNPYLLSWYVQW